MPHRGRSIRRSLSRDTATSPTISYELDGQHWPTKSRHSTLFPGRARHCLRHAFCTLLAEAGTPVHVIKEPAGRIWSGSGCHKLRRFKQLWTRSVHATFASCESHRVQKRLDYKTEEVLVLKQILRSVTGKARIDFNEGPSRPETRPSRSLSDLASIPRLTPLRTSSEPQACVDYVYGRP